MTPTLIYNDIGVAIAFGERQRVSFLDVYEKFLNVPFSLSFPLLLPFFFKLL
jgi:hypothetical protein